MRIGKLDIDLKTNNPFRLGQYVLRLIDLVKSLRNDIKTRDKEIAQLRKELEELKKNFP